MRTLFELEDAVPPIPGLLYVPDFLDAARERELVELIDLGEWDTTWERRRQLFGVSYGRDRQSLAPLPDWGRTLADQAARAAAFPDPFDQMLINEYLPGQGIALHRDYDPFDRTVVSISLISCCVMDFRRVTDNRCESVLLRPTSLLALTDEARYEWEHGIARRKNDCWNGTLIPRSRRVSVTFRRLKKNLTQ